MNQNDKEGQSSGRTTGASGNQAEQQNRTIQGQDSEPGKVWQESEKGQYTGQGDTSTHVGGGSSQGSYGGQSQSGQSQSSHGGQGGETGEGGIRGGFNETRGSSSEDVSEETNRQMDESQWQGSRFSQGGSTGNQNG